MDKEKQAIEWLKLGSEMSLEYYQKPLLLCYSGGKDSDVVLELAKRSGIPFEVQHSHTTADAPQTVYHVRDVFRELELEGIKCSIDYPVYKGKRVTLWDLIEIKLMPPTRIVRYCCAVCKETAGKGRQIITGVRKGESTNRSNRGAIEALGKTKAERVKYNGEEMQTSLFLNNDNDPKRKIIESCMKQNKTTCNPVIDWTDADIWDYIRTEKININELYSLGFDRVGCIGCPMAGDRRNFEFSVFPKYKNMYIHAFDRMIKRRADLGKDVAWKNGEECFAWWMQDDNIAGQIGFGEVDAACQQGLQ